MSAAKPILLYDGDCGICSALIDWAARLDAKNRFTRTAFQAFPGEARQAYDLSEAEFARGLYLVYPETGRVYHGVFALNRFLFAFFPYTLLVIMLYVLPILLLAEWAVYALVARYRSRISDRLGLSACRRTTPSSEQ